MRKERKNSNFHIIWVRDTLNSSEREKEVKRSNKRSLYTYYFQKNQETLNMLQWENCGM